MLSYWMFVQEEDATKDIDALSREVLGCEIGSRWTGKKQMSFATYSRLQVVELVRIPTLTPDDALGGWFEPVWGCYDMKAASFWFRLFRWRRNEP
ncbi:hypothetical protein Hdeb2414_s0018g00524611 [Helianthus debilis subsp. tardiflorus]